MKRIIFISTIILSVTFIILAILACPNPINKNNLNNANNEIKPEITNKSQKEENYDVNIEVRNSGNRVETDLLPNPNLLDKGTRPSIFITDPEKHTEQYDRWTSRMRDVSEILRGSEYKITQDDSKYPFFVGVAEKNSFARI